jgi:folylpolyglutamate synthase/dihydropteroate synthase
LPPSAALPSTPAGADGGQREQQRDAPPLIVLDGAHTPESAAALAAALREAFPWPTPLALVVAMAGDKQHREVAAALRAARPGVAVFTAAPVAGSSQRSAAPGTLVAHWQAAAMLSTGPSFRCRELIQGGVNSALPRALREVAAMARSRAAGGGGGAEGAAGGHPGVVCVTGSLHAVAAASRELEAMWG